MNLEEIVPLLGKSERDEAVQAMLSALGVKQPLRRPKRGDCDSYVEKLPEHEHYEMQFCFSTADSIDIYTQEHLDGELVFFTIFVFPNEKSVADNVFFPLGVSAQPNRAEHLKRLGEPEDGNPDLRKYRWDIGGVKVFIQYAKDGKIIQQISYAFGLA